MKKMKRVLVALLSCLTAFACLAGTVACGEDKKADSSTNNTASSVTESSKEEVASSEEASKEEVSSEEVSSEEVSSEEVESSEEEVSSEEESSEEESSEEVESSEEEAPHECDLTSVLKKVAASCKDGYIQYGCECGELGELVVIPATGEHVLTNLPEKPATCTEAGYEAYLGCLNCDYNADAGVEPVAPVKPQWADFVVFGEVAADMYQKALEQYKAEYDAYETAHAEWEANQVVVIPALGHTYVDVADAVYEKTEADCENYGLEVTEKYCVTCFEKWMADNAEAMAKAEEEAIKAGEVWDEDLYVAANCDVISIKITAALGHDYVNPADKKSSFVPGKPATCTEDGYEWSAKCYREDCGWEKSAATITALGHDYENDDDVNEDGKVDEKDFKNANSKYATCSNDAYCGVCGYTAEGTSAAIEHDWIADDGVYPVSCTKDGLEEAKVCKDCGYKTGVVIKATGHDWSEVLGKADFEELKADKENPYVATCTEAVYKDHFICTECDAFGQGTYDSKKVDGETVYTLKKIVEKKESEVIYKAATGHSYVVNYTKNDKDATAKGDSAIKTLIETLHKDAMKAAADDEYVSIYDSYSITLECACGEKVNYDTTAHSYESYYLNVNGEFVAAAEALYGSDGKVYAEDAEIPEGVTVVAYKKYQKDTQQLCSICDKKYCEIENNGHIYLEEVDVKDVEAVAAEIERLAGLDIVVKAEDFAAYYAKNYFAEVAATCASKGNRHYVICLCCGDYAVEIDSHYETEVEWNGEKVDAKEFINIDKVSEHNWMDVEYKLPTCEEAGYTDHKVCKICAAKNADYKVLAALGHRSSVTGSCADTVVCDGYYTEWVDADKDGIIDADEYVEDSKVECEEHVANKNKGAHSWNEGTCGVCGAVCAHNYVDNKCTICKDKKENGGI